jgi:hypothetical protein
MTSDGDLPVRLHPGGKRKRPENLGGIVDVDVVVEDENIFCQSQVGAAAAALSGSPSDIFFIEMKTLSVAPAGADRLDSRHRFAAAS